MQNSNAIVAESNVHTLVPIQRGRISGVEEDLVNARALHIYLESRRQFSDWITQRIVKFGFEQNVDYVIASQNCEAKRGGRNRIDYQVTLDMAKELSMVENNEKGRKARRYFIECEKRLHVIAPLEAVTIMGQTIGTDGFHMLGAVVKGKVTGLPQCVQRRATAKIWSQTHAAFGVRSAADIPAEQLDSARNFIAAYVVSEGEFIPRKPKAERLEIHYPVSALAERRPSMWVDRGSQKAWLDVTLNDLRDIPGQQTPCEAIFGILHEAGYNIEGAWWELRTYRNKMRELVSFAKGMGQVVESPQRYAVEGSDAA